MPDAAGTAPHRQARSRLVPVLAAVVFVVFLAAPPRALAEKAWQVGYGLCHQQPDRSFFVGRRQLPLCARDTGTYLGAAVTLLCMLGTSRRLGTSLPHPWVLAVLALGGAFFVVDGVNSYAGAFPFLPRLYEPDNRLRLLSGLMLGTAMAAALLPLFNYTLWRSAPAERPLNGRALLALPAALTLAYLAVTNGPAWLYLPLAVGLALTVLLVLAAVNGLLVTVILRHDRRGTDWRDLVHLLSWGVLLTAIELGFLSGARYLAETALR